MNKAFVTGNITKDLELKRANDKSYLKFTIASRRDKETADFIPCIAWGKTAELIAQYHKKGDPIGVLGSIRTGSYESQNGKIYTTDLLVTEIEFMKRNESKPKEEAKHKAVEDINFLDAPSIDVSPDDLPFY